MSQQPPNPPYVGIPTQHGPNVQPGFAHPTWNKYNEMPGPAIPDPGQWRWYNKMEALAFTPVGVGALQTCVWKTPVFDLRPELRTGDEVTKWNTVPINRAGALGIGVMLRILLYGGPIVPALVGQMTVTTWNEVGLVDPATLFRVDVPTDCTSTVQDGGESAAAVFPAPAFTGASLLYFEPPSSVPRFWRFWMQIQMDAAVAAPLFNLDASVE